MSAFLQIADTSCQPLFNFDDAYCTKQCSCQSSTSRVSAEARLEAKRETRPRGSKRLLVHTAVQYIPLMKVIPGSCASLCTCVLLLRFHKRSEIRSPLALRRRLVDAGTSTLDKLLNYVYCGRSGPNDANGVSACTSRRTW
jgi:hypothetical protein